LFPEDNMFVLRGGEEETCWDGERGIGRSREGGREGRREREEKRNTLPLCPCR
jgi:hypothetical protein